MSEAKKSDLFSSTTSARDILCCVVCNKTIEKIKEGMRMKQYEKCFVAET